MITTFFSTGLLSHLFISTLELATHLYFRYSSKYRIIQNGKICYDSHDLTFNIMDEQFNFKWHTFESHGQQVLKNLLETPEFSDITLVSDDQHPYKVHRFILSAGSSVFRNILTNNPLNTSIYLRGIHHEELESILQFLYLGETAIKQARMNQFLNVAINMGVKELDSNILDNKESNVKEEKTSHPASQVEKQSNKIIDINTTGNDNFEVQETENFDKKVQIEVNDEKSLTLHDKKQYLCDQCDYTSAQYVTLKNHKQSKHEGIRYPCDQCDYKAPRIDSLKKHIRTVHEGIKYPCEQCDYQATMPYILKVHVKTQHEGIKYQCEKCDCSFNHSNNLLSHIRYKHEDIKYSCLQCDFQAPRSKALQRHIKAKHE